MRTATPKGKAILRARCIILPNLNCKILKLFDPKIVSRGLKGKISHIVILIAIMSEKMDSAWEKIALAFVDGLSAEWLSRMPEGMIFELSMPNDNRGGISKLRIQRIPESDAEAISRVLDLGDRIIEPIDDKTLKDAR